MWDLQDGMVLPHTLCLWRKPRGAEDCGGQDIGEKVYKLPSKGGMWSALVWADDKTIPGTTLLPFDWQTVRSRMAIMYCVIAGSSGASLEDGRGERGTTYTGASTCYAQNMDATARSIWLHLSYLLTQVGPVSRTLEKLIFM